jgi:hypothetical protein
MDVDETGEIGVGETGRTYRLSVGNSEVKRTLVRPRLLWAFNVKLELK